MLKETKRWVMVIFLVLAAGLAVAACGPSHSKVESSASAQRSQARQVLQSATANPSVQVQVAKAKRDVVNPCIDASSGPVSFENCVKAKLPKAQRKAAMKCVAKAAVADHIKTYAGKTKWLDTDVPACVGAVLP